MTPLFTLNAGEYFVADELKNKLKDVSVFVPASPQEKGIDLLLYSFLQDKKETKTLTVQVKQSRSYAQKNGWYDLFFNGFHVYDNADWFILVGVYPKLKNTSEKNNTTNLEWGKIFLAFKNEEMKKFLNSLHQKKDSRKQEKRFGFKFSVSGDCKALDIYHTRGASEEKCFCDYLLERRMGTIAKELKTTLKNAPARKKNSLSD